LVPFHQLNLIIQHQHQLINCWHIGYNMR